MDSTTLDSLKAALAATPENAQLRMVIIRGLAEADRADEAATVLLEVPAEDLGSDADRLVAADLLLGLERATEAMAYCAGDSPEALVCRCRCHLELGEQDSARAAYDRAIAANPTLEDAEIARRLAGVDKAVRLGPDRPRLRVISNDDTVETEALHALLPEQAPITFADVGGLADIKKTIHKKIILPFQKPTLFQKFRKRVGGGILLYGAPGCGKTLLARATAGECNATFFNVAISDVLDMWQGESEQKLHAIFDKARSSAPSVIFFDELEALGGRRQFTREATSSKLVSQFLAEMDGFSQNNTGVLILGATNVPWSIDPAFRRPGRFDRVLFVPPPDLSARVEILEILLAGRPVADDIDPKFLARHTSSFSGADLSNLVESGVEEAIEASIESGDEVPISQAHLRAALQEVRPTTAEWLSTARNHARYANEGGQYDEVLHFLEKHGKN